jgi:Zn-dependent protease
MSFEASSIILIILSLVIAITIHEMMHAFTAHWLGDPTAADEGRITLNPLPHIDPIMTIALPAVLIIAGLPPILAAKPVPFNPDRVRFDEFGAALVGLAGPLTNLVLAIASAGLLGVLQPDFGSLPRDFLLIFMQINVGLFVFNMLPLPPLDGSRVLYAFAPEPVQRVMLQIEQMGIVATLLMLFLLIQLGILGPIISNVNDFILRLLV